MSNIPAWLCVFAHGSSGLANVRAAGALRYGLPYLVINALVVCYTWLQHTDTTFPISRRSEWNCEGSPADR